MASGDVTGEYDERLSGTKGSKPVCGLTLEVVVADGSSEKEEVLDEADHSCMNCALTYLNIEVPVLATTDKTVKLDLLTERDNVIMSTYYLNAAKANSYPFLCQQSLMGETKFKISCDENVSGAKSFFVQIRGGNYG